MPPHRNFRNKIGPQSHSAILAGHCRDRPLSEPLRTDAHGDSRTDAASRVPESGKLVHGGIAGRGYENMSQHAVKPKLPRRSSKSCARWKNLRHPLPADRVFAPKCGPPGPLIRTASVRARSKISWNGSAHSPTSPRRCQNAPRVSPAYHPPFT